MRRQLLGQTYVPVPERGGGGLSDNLNFEENHMRNSKRPENTKVLRDRKRLKSEPPKMLCWPTTTHVLDPETGQTLRVWRGIGENGTEVEFLVRAFGVMRRTKDKDGIVKWFETYGSVHGDIIDCGPVPPTLSVRRQPEESLH
jgi:hypothetical protein